jgi:ribose transport system substrate-binding protein
MTRALNSVLEEAVDEGIVVIAIDQEIGAEGVINVVIDQTEWARISARWLAEELGGEGEIVLIEGFVGHPANEARMAGVQEVLDEYPGITVVGRESGQWDQATGQQVMSDFLASLPNIDAVWTQDGMALGALTAVQTANPEEWPIMVGEARAGYLQLWDQILETRPDFTSIGVVNPPGVAADGLRVAVELLQGAEINPDALAGPFGNSLYVPIPEAVTAENFEEVFAEYGDEASSYTLDSFITQEEAQQLIAGELMATDEMMSTEEADMEMTEEPAATSDPAADAAAMEALAGSGPFTIGISNGFVGSEWRTQMIQNFEDTAQEFTDAGIPVELVIESADVDVQGQIQQVQNLINRGVDAIIINPNDQAALNSVLEEAVDEGIVVIAIDQEIGAEGVYNVVIDQTEWARISARWLAEELGGEGEIVLIEGFVGHPANEARMAGVQEVLDEYPGITVVGRESGQWDQATGQQVMSDFLASLPNIDAVWTQDGMALGALTAVQTANPEEWPIMVGEARAGYLQLWDQILETRPDFTSIGVVNPPGVASAGLRVAVELLAGNTVDESQLAGPFGNSLYVPIPEAITAENFEEVFAEYGDEPSSYTLDSFIGQSEAHAFMAQ